MLIKLLGAFFFSYYFVNIANIPMVIKKIFSYPPYKRIKPLDCVVCLSVWVALALYLLPQEYSDCIFILFGAGYLANFLSK